MKKTIYESKDLIALSHTDKEQDLIQELLPTSGYVIVGGDTGMGKTNEMLHLWFSFASKQGSYHGLAVRQCPPLYINLEDDECKLGKRIEIIRPLYDLAFEPKMMCLNNLYLDTSEGKAGLTTIITYLRDNKYDVKVVIMDSLKYAINSDYLKSQSAKRWTDSVKELSKSLGVSFVFTHHTRKLHFSQGHTEDLESGERIKGAKDFLDHAESVILYATHTEKRRFGDEIKHIRETTLVPVKTRHAVSDLQSQYLKLLFDRKRLYWNGQHYQIDGDKANIVEE